MPYKTRIHLFPFIDALPNDTTPATQERYTISEYNISVRLTCSLFRKGTTSQATEVTISFRPVHSLTSVNSLCGSLRPGPETEKNSIAL